MQLLHQQIYKVGKISLLIRLNKRSNTERPPKSIQFLIFIFNTHTLSKMYKCIVVIYLFVVLGLVQSAPLNESDDVKSGMESALSRGLKAFGSAAQDEPRNKGPGTKVPVHSHYTKGIKALGGGKPALFEQYRLHNYTPLAPSIIPREFEVSEKMTPEEAAKIYVPSPPLQHTTDRLHIP